MRYTLGQMPLYQACHIFLSASTATGNFSSCFSRERRSCSTSVSACVSGVWMPMIVTSLPGEGVVPLAVPGVVVDAVDAAEGEEVDDHDLAAEGLDGERVGVEPGLYSFKLRRIGGAGADLGEVERLAQELAVDGLLPLVELREHLLVSIGLQLFQFGLNFFRRARRRGVWRLQRLRLARKLVEISASVSCCSGVSLRRVETSLRRSES